ncbi:MAG: phosphatidate cytidylyltransferase [Bacteroidota bacterium]
MPAPPASVSYRGEVWRKALHILTALACPLLIWLIGLGATLWLIGMTALIAILADFTRAYTPEFQAFIEHHVGFMMRGEESDAETPVLNGATWVLIAITLLLLVFPASIALPVFIMFMLADAAAALVGRRYGRKNWMGGSRTVEGSTAFFLVAAAVLTLLATLPWWVVGLAASTAALLEAIDMPLNDNLVVPFCTTLLVALVLHFGMGRSVDWLPIL